jgi:hypothetical protein
MEAGLRPRSGSRCLGVFAVAIVGPMRVARILPWRTVCCSKNGRVSLDGQPEATVTTLSYERGVPPLIPSSYNGLAMSTVCDAAHESQFASWPIAQVRVLAAQPSVPAALSGQSAIAFASQPLR